MTGKTKDNRTAVFKRHPTEEHREQEDKKKKTECSGTDDDPAQAGFFFVSRHTHDARTEAGDALGLFG